MSAVTPFTSALLTGLASLPFEILYPILFQILGQRAVTLFKENTLGGPSIYPNSSDLRNGLATLETCTWLTSSAFSVVCDTNYFIFHTPEDISTFLTWLDHNKALHQIRCLHVILPNKAIWYSPKGVTALFTLATLQQLPGLRRLYITLFDGGKTQLWELSHPWIEKLAALRNLGDDWEELNFGEMPRDANVAIIARRAGMTSYGLTQLRDMLEKTRAPTARDSLLLSVNEVAVDVEEIDRGRFFW